MEQDMSRAIKPGFHVAAIIIFMSAAVSGGEEQFTRIIALSPAVAEIIYELGGEERLVGVSAYADYPPRAKVEKPTVGGILNMDIERIVSLKPDIILGNESVTARDKLAPLGLRLEEIPDETIEDIGKSFERIGALVGKAPEGRKLKERLTKAVAEAAARVKDRPRVKALVVIGHEPLWVAGGYGFVNELLEAAGGENAAGTIKKDFYGIDAERVLSGDPDVIVDLTLEDSSDARARSAALSFWKRFGGLSAVERGRVEFVETDLLTLPGPRLARGVAALQEALFAEKEDESEAKPKGGGK